MTAFMKAYLSLFLFLLNMSFCLGRTVLGFGPKQLLVTLESELLSVQLLNAFRFNLFINLPDLSHSKCSSDGTRVRCHKDVMFLFTIILTIPSV